MSARSLTVAEAAQVLRLSEKAIRRRVERGVLPSERVDGRVRIPASALGLDSGATEAPTSEAPAVHTPSQAAGAGSSLTDELLDRVERLARENGELRARRWWRRTS